MKRAKSVHRKRGSPLVVYPELVPAGRRSAFGVRGKELVGPHHTTYHRVVTDLLYVTRWVREEDPKTRLHRLVEKKVPLLRFRCTCPGWEYGHLCYHVTGTIKTVMPGASVWDDERDAIRQHRKKYEVVGPKGKPFWLTDRTPKVRR